MALFDGGLEFLVEGPREAGLWSCTMVNTAQRPALSENIVRVGTCEDTSLLAELGARTFRESSPNTPHEDLERYLKENFTRENLFAYLSMKSAAALVLEKTGQAIGYALLSPSTAPNRSVPPHSIQLKGTSKNRRFPPRCKSNSRFSCSERGELAWDSLVFSI